MGNPGVYASNTGISVYDASGVERTTLGNIGGGTYGLKVISSDGTTVIVDGTSDMFRISATGTIALDLTTTTESGASVTLSALGNYTTAPAVLSHNTSDTTLATGNRYVGQSRSFDSPAYVATTSGGAVTFAVAVASIVTNGGLRLEGSPGNLTVIFWGASPGGGIYHNAGMRYWVLAQVAI